MKSNKRSLRSVFSHFLDCYNFYLLASLPNILAVPNFERFINIVYRDIVIHSWHEMCPGVVSEMRNEYLNLKYLK